MFTLHTDEQSGRLLISVHRPVHHSADCTVYGQDWCKRHSLQATADGQPGVATGVIVSHRSDLHLAGVPDCGFCRCIAPVVVLATSVKSGREEYSGLREHDIVSDQQLPVYHCSAHFQPRAAVPSTAVHE